MLFEEPVDLDQFPAYLGIVGGEENMMDLGTMQGKVDDGEYRSMDAVEVSVIVSRVKREHGTMRPH